jgi:hypothetical protein
VLRKKILDKKPRCGCYILGCVVH